MDALELSDHCIRSYHITNTDINHGGAGKKTPPLQNSPKSFPLAHAYGKLTINGDVYANESWQKIRDLLSLKDNIYGWGKKINFGSTGNSTLYELDGWSYTEYPQHTEWTVGKKASLLIPINGSEVPDIVTMKISFMPFLVPGKLDKQNVKISINQQPIFNQEVASDDFEDYAITVPKDLLTGHDRMVITFHTPDAASENEIGVGVGKLVKGVNIRYITFE